MGCFRITLTGIRQVAIIDSLAILAFLKDSKMDSAFWLTSCTQEKLNEFLAMGNKVHICTVGPGDALYIPPGSLTRHQVQKDFDVYGLRVGVTSPQTLRIMQELVKARGDAGQPENACMQQAIAMLTGAGAPETVVAMGGSVAAEAAEDWVGGLVPEAFAVEVAEAAKEIDVNDL